MTLFTNKTQMGEKSCNSEIYGHQVYIFIEEKLEICVVFSEFCILTGNDMSKPSQTSQRARMNFPTP